MLGFVTLRKIYNSLSIVEAQLSILLVLLQLYTLWILFLRRFQFSNEVINFSIATRVQVTDGPRGNADERGTSVGYALHGYFILKVHTFLIGRTVLVNL